MRCLALLLSMSALAFSGNPPPPPDCKCECEVVCTVETSLLWPPNHNLVDVGLEVDGNPSIQVYSDEDDVWPASAQFSPDAKLSYGNLRLRSERGGPSDGRVYLIVAGDCALTVVVPHDLSAASIASVLDQAEDALEYWETNGVPPPSFYLVGDGPVIGPKQ
jgi:hypothetical protein